MSIGKMLESLSQWIIFCSSRRKAALFWFIKRDEQTVIHCQMTNIYLSETNLISSKIFQRAHSRYRHLILISARCVYLPSYMIHDSIIGILEVTRWQFIVVTVSLGVDIAQINKNWCLYICDVSGWEGRNMLHFVILSLKICGNESIGIILWMSKRFYVLCNRYYWSRPLWYCSLTYFLCSTLFLSIICYFFWIYYASDNPIFALLHIKQSRPMCFLVKKACDVV